MKNINKEVKYLIQKPNTPASTKSKRHSFLTIKLFLITQVIIFLLILIYAGIYLYLNSQLDQISKSNKDAVTTQPSPTPVNETVNWKTYRNDDFGFEVKYPSEWEAKYMTRIGFSTLSILNPEAEQKLKNMQGELSFSGGIYIEIIPNKKTIEEFVKEEYRDLEKNKDGVIEKYDVLFPNGMSALRVRKFSPHGSGYVKLLNNKEEGIVFEFPEALLAEATLAEAGYPSETYDQILSTFKFTN